ncbi:MAG: cell surface protein SprA [Hymenobacter sp.]
MPQAQRLIPQNLPRARWPTAFLAAATWTSGRRARVTLKAGARFNRNENPALTLRQQRVGDFMFDQNMNLNLSGQIGTKLKLAFNYDTKAAFDFDNQMKFDYAGQETDIIRKLDLGNVSLPLNNSLVQGGQNLFGIKTQLQFGRLGVTAVAATVRGTADEVRVQNGAQSRQFELKASQYERDRHFFLSHFFRETLRPGPAQPAHRAERREIRRLEVYVTNDNRTTDNLRNVVALDGPGRARARVPAAVLQQPPPRAADAGRRTAPTSSYGHALNRAGQQARNNFTVDDVLATCTGGRRHATAAGQKRGLRAGAGPQARPARVHLQCSAGLREPEHGPAARPGAGRELRVPLQRRSLQGGRNRQTITPACAPDEVIFLKMLKATNPGVGRGRPRPRLLNNPNLAQRNTPTWDLMMKNIYPLNARSSTATTSSSSSFTRTTDTGVDLISLKEGVQIANRPLIEVLNLDNVNPNNDRNPDGNFDYFPGITIDPELGKIIFPNVEPFGYVPAGAVRRRPPKLALSLTNTCTTSCTTRPRATPSSGRRRTKFLPARALPGQCGTDEISLPGIRRGAGLGAGALGLDAAHGRRATTRCSTTRRR